MYTERDHTFAVCAYGESQYLDECLASLALQELTSNIIVVTSTPCKHISDTAARYGVKLIESGHAPSIAGDWNFALSQAGTSLVTIAHQDDVYLPDYSAKMLDCMNATVAKGNAAGQPIIFFTDYGELRDDDVVLDNRILRVKRLMLAPLKAKRLQGSRVVRRRILSLGCAICCPSVTYNTDLLGTNVFTSKMKCSLDWDTWERLSSLRGQFCYCPDVLMLHRIHSGSETTRLIHDNTRSEEDLQILRRFWPDAIASLIARLYYSSQASNET